MGVHRCVYFVGTMSSILIIIRTVSVASSMADEVTRRGCTMFSSRLLVMTPRLASIPAFFSPAACLARSSVTILMGLRPAFSARV